MAIRRLRWQMEVAKCSFIYVYIFMCLNILICRYKGPMLYLLKGQILLIGPLAMTWAWLDASKPFDNRTEARAVAMHELGH